MQTRTKWFIALAMTILVNAGIIYAQSAPTSSNLTLTLNGGTITPASFFASGDGGVANNLGVGNSLEVANNIDAGTAYINGHTVVKGQLKVSSGLTSSIQLVNGEGVNFSLADNNAYISRSGTDTLRIGNGTASALTVGSIFIAGTGAGYTTIASTKNNGTISDMSGGDGTATVGASTTCVCSCSAGTPTALTCSLLSTTLTATDATCTAVNYHCF